MSSASSYGLRTRIVLSIGVDDVDETLGRVTALGGSVSSGPIDMPWGQRVAHIQDPTATRSTDALS